MQESTYAGTRIPIKHGDRTQKVKIFLPFETERFLMPDRAVLYNTYNHGRV